MVLIDFMILGVVFLREKSKQMVETFNLIKHRVARLVNGF